MRVRYCHTEFGKTIPCQVGWSNMDSNGKSESCLDEPKEKNCRNLVDPMEMVCPTCGRKWIRPYREYVLERAFGTKLSETFGILKQMLGRNR